MLPRLKELTTPCFFGSHCVLFTPTLASTNQEKQTSKAHDKKPENYKLNVGGTNSQKTGKRKSTRVHEGEKKETKKWNR